MKKISLLVALTIATLSTSMAAKKTYGNATYETYTNSMGDTVKLVSIDNSSDESLNFRCSSDGAEIFLATSAPFDASLDELKVRWKSGSLPTHTEVWSMSTDHSGLFVNSETVKTFAKQARGGTKLIISAFVGPSYNIWADYVFNTKGLNEALKNLKCM